MTGPITPLGSKAMSENFYKISLDSHVGLLVISFLGAG